MPEEPVDKFENKSVQIASQDAALEAILIKAKGGNKILGCAAASLSVIVFAFVLIIAIVDLLELSGVLARDAFGGDQVGGLLGILLRSLFLGAICVGGFLYGLSRIDPLRFSKEAVAEFRLKRLYNEEQLHQRSWSVLPECDINYYAYDTIRLADVCSNINKDLAQDRYPAFLCAVKKNIEKDKAVVRVTRDSLAIECEGKKLQEVHWNDICRIVTYKRDLFAHDIICLGFLTDPNQEKWFELAEGDLGFLFAADEARKRFPEIPENWYGEVMLPPFETNMTVLYERAKLKEKENE